MSGTTKGEVIDPYVVLEMHGVEPDCNKYQTAVVKNNGFNPTWNEVKKREGEGRKGRRTGREEGAGERTEGRGSSEKRRGSEERTTSEINVFSQITDVYLSVAS